MLAWTGRTRRSITTLGAWAKIGLLISFWLCGSLVGFAGVEQNDALSNDVGRGSIRFQRIHVPADRMEQWPRDKGRYLPMAADEFERLLKKTNAATESESTRIVKAEYHASLSEIGLLEGNATLQIDTSAERPILLSLGNSRIAMHNARWHQSRKTTTLGLGHRGNLNLLVEEPGRLHFDWSLKGIRGIGNTRRFNLNLPPSTKTTLVLDLPDDVTATCHRGICTNKTSSIEGRKTWHFELGGQQTVSILLAHAETMETTNHQPEVHESLVYGFAEDGIELKADLHIEGIARPLQQVSLLLDPGLKLVNAQLGQTAVKWSIMSTPDEAFSRVVIELPETPQEAGHVLHLAALCPLTLDRPWRLPRIRPQAMFWRGGNATLVVPSPLSIAQLKPIDCRQSRLGSLPTSSEGETAEFQYFTPDSTVELVVARPCVAFNVDCVTHIELDGSEAVGEMTAIVLTNDHELFELEARLNRPWIVDSVTSDTAGLVRDWRQSHTADGNSRLMIRLGKPHASKQQGLKIKIAGRRLQSPLGRVLHADDLTMAVFPSAKTRQRWLTVRARPPYELVVRGDRHLNKALPSNINEQTRQLLSVENDELTFLHDSMADDLRLKLIRQRTGLACDIHATADVSSKSLLESYRIRCTPRSSRVDRVLVHFTLARDEPLQWKLDGEDNQPLVARRLTQDEQLAIGMTSGGETWEVPLVPSRNEPFEVLASRAVRLKAAMPISLASLPKADTQTGTLVIRADEAAPLRIVNRRLDQIPTEPATQSEYQTARATFRYQPEQFVLSTSSNPIMVQVEGDFAGAAPLFAWNCQIDSRYEANGGSRHLATYCLENTGRPNFRVTWPHSSRKRQIREVWVDGQNASWRLLEDNSQLKTVSIDLPPKRRFPIVGIEFFEDSPSLGLLATLEPPALEPDIPVLATHWVAWIPASHRSLYTDACPAAYPIESPRWRQRLFGPLGRAGDSGPFNPLNVQAWSKLNPLASDNKIKNKASRFLTTLGQRQPTKKLNGPATMPTLGKILDGISTRKPGMTILVDQPALASSGVSPVTVVRTDPNSKQLDRGMSILRQTDLDLLFVDNAVLITTSNQAALLQAHLKPMENSHLWQVLPGSLMEDLEEASRKGDHDRWRHVANWVKQAKQSNTPWPLAYRRSPSANDTPGWNAYCQGLSCSQPARLKIVHRHGIPLARWTAFLLAIALGRWTLGTRPARLFVALGTCSLLAVLLPTLPSAVASGALLGILFCLATYFLIRREGNTNQDDTAFSISTSFLKRPVLAPTETLRNILILVFLLGCSAVSFGQQPSETGTIHQVLIPIDQQRKPSSGQVFVPQTLYDLLNRQAASSRGNVEGWLIERATYQGELAWEGMPKRLVPGKMRANFYLRTFNSPAHVRIPLLKDQLELGDNWASLDGHVIQPTWGADGRELSFTVGAEGYYRLELVFTPNMQTLNHASARDPSKQATRGFEVAIPRVPRSRLELALPANANTVKVPLAQGNVVVKDQELSAELGGTDRLRVRWSADASDPSTNATIEADQLLWLNITPGSVVVDARFHVRVLEGRVSEIRLTADPRLKLLGDPSIGRLETLPGSPQNVRVKLPAAQSDNFTLAVRFSLQDMSGVGRHRLPLLALEGARIGKRWFAVSVDESLLWTEDGTLNTLKKTSNPLKVNKNNHKNQPANKDAGGLQHVAIPDFLAAWGDTDSTARLAYGYSGDVPPWSLAARPRAPKTVVDQWLTADFGPKRAEVQYEARIDTNAGYGFRYRMRVPPNLKIESLAVYEKNVDRLARWSRATDGSVDLVLSGPATVRRRLELLGHISTPKQGLVDLPMPRIEGASLQFFHVNILRQSPILLELDRYDGLEEAETEVVASDLSSRSRPVVSLINSGRKTPQARVRISPNRPKLDVRETLTMEHVNGRWQAKARFEVEPREGLVDEIRLAVPPELIDRCQVDPPSMDVQTELADNGKELVLRPTRPIVDSWQCAMTIPLADNVTSVPDIAIKNTHAQTRHLILPRQLGARAARWETRRLEKTSTTPHATTYKIIGNKFRATLLSPNGSDGKTRVYLADVRVAWRDDGAIHGAAHFDLEGAGRSSCPLLLPKDYQIVQVAVDGVPTTIEPSKTEKSHREQDEQCRYKIPLGSQRLPKQISIVFAGRLPSGVGRSACTIDVPRLGDLPVEKTIWTVLGSPQYKITDQTDALRSLFDVFRADSFNRILETAVKSNALAADKSCWTRVQSTRYTHLQSALKKHLDDTNKSSTPQPVEKTIEALHQRWTSLLEQIDNPALLDSDMETVEPSCCDVQASTGAIDHSESVAHYFVTDDLKPLTLRYHHTVPSWAASHMPAAVLLGLVFLLGYFGTTRGTWQALYRRWPAGLMVTTGLAWWWLLTPSILGLIIAIVGVWLTIRSPRHLAHDAHSKVVHIG